MTRDQLQARIGELDREINSQVAAVKMPSSSFRRGFPWFTWIVCGLLFGWWYYGQLIPGAQDIHVNYNMVGFYGGILLGVLALWGTLLYMIQPSVKVSAEYRANSEKVRMLQEERRELMIELRSLEGE